MIALCFEVTPRPGEDDRYLQIAASLRPELEASGGCQFLDRYRSLTRPRTMLSHQLWTDEASLTRWRANARHHTAQTAGRGQVFEDYRLRVGVVALEGSAGKVLRDHAIGVAYNDPAHVAERWMLIVRSSDVPFAADGEAYRSVYREADYAFVGSVADRAAGVALIDRALSEPGTTAAQLCLVSRDYGMTDRREAPQYFAGA
jgi:heme-degrading monooxygenase HmoA